MHPLAFGITPRHLEVSIGPKAGGTRTQRYSVEVGLAKSVWFENPHLQTHASTNG